MSRGRIVSCLVLTLSAIALHAGTFVQFRTVFGDIDVELFEKDKPVTVSNFIRYIQSGKYKDGFIHRCVPGFVIQGGGWYVAQRGTSSAYITNLVPFALIKNEYGVGNIYSNAYGTIAMAKLGGDTNSASSQWFFNLTNNFFLDAHDSDHYFTVFGRVVRGTNILNIFNTFEYYNGTNTNNIIANLGGALSEMPLRAPYLNESTIIYVDVSLLNVQVTKVNNVPEISWNSVTGRVNRVEYTTIMPPSWNLLISTNGDGTSMKVQDPASGGPQRFYRVTVSY